MPLWGLKLLLTPKPTWVLRILTGTRLTSGGILWYSYTLPAQDRGSQAKQPDPEDRGRIKTH